MVNGTLLAVERIVDLVHFRVHIIVKVGLVPVDGPVVHVLVFIL